MTTIQLAFCSHCSSNAQASKMAFAQEENHQRVMPADSLSNGKDRIISSALSQVVAATRNATQRLISKGIAFLWLLVVVCGFLGIFGIVFGTFSAQPTYAPADMFHPVDEVVSSRTIRYDRRPRRPGAVAIGFGIVVAVVVLAVVWFQMTFFERPAAAFWPPGARTSAPAFRRKIADTEEAPDPMTMGGANDQLASMAHQWWIAMAARAGIDLTGFDPRAPLAERIAWAIQAGLEIAVVLSRFSFKLQHSTEAQVQHNMEYAGGHMMYVPPEFICVDEAKKGRQVRRHGLERAKAILKTRQAQTLLVFKVSRLLRTGYKSAQFVNEEVVEEGLRAVSTSQGIDTRDKKTWKTLMYMNGIMDEMLLETIADHCRAGLKTLFQQGFTTGALTVGYRRVEVPGAPLTNRKLPRTAPAIDAEVAKLIKQHFEWNRDGMSIREGWRRWVAAGGPADPRSGDKCMSYSAYRRLLSNPRYLGLWAFGRKRNQWNSKRDYNQQVVGPEAELSIFRCEDLRIIDDELFFAVQERLAKLKTGPRGPHKQKKDIHLWDLITEFFFCAKCKVRFHQAGGGGKGMRCKRADLCPCLSAISRRQAVEVVCKKLTELIKRDAELLHNVVCGVREVDAAGDEQVQADIASLKSRIQVLTSKIDDLEELAGHGSDEDRQRRKARIHAASLDRGKLQVELSHLEKCARVGAKAITSDTIDQILEDFAGLLDAAANGKLGSDLVYRAASVFGRLVGKQIWVHVEKRPGRKQTVVRGVFTPHLLHAVARATETVVPNDCPAAETVEVWFREPPKLDALAERVHQLIDIEGLSQRETAARLREEGHKVNCGNVWYMYRRWYEMQGLPMPKQHYNNGRPRKPR